MHIHPIQTGTVAVKEQQRAGVGRGGTRLVHTHARPSVDRAASHPRLAHRAFRRTDSRRHRRGYVPPWHPYFRLAVREWVTPEQEIGAQLQRLGFAPRDVRRVILTHLHTDHAGGLEHFPASEILVTGTELDLARSTLGKLRGYLPHRWPRWLDPTSIDFKPTPFGPFTHSYPLTDASDVVLLPTPGHTPGTCPLLCQPPSAMASECAARVVPVGVRGCPVLSRCLAGHRWRRARRTPAGASFGCQAAGASASSPSRATCGGRGAAACARPTAPRGWLRRAA